MRRLVLIVVLAGCSGAADGESCSSYDDCDSGKCGAGVCFAGECPCNDGWECVNTGCGLFECSHECRRLCASHDECSPGFKCNGSHCMYDEPQVAIEVGGPYIVPANSTLTISATAAVPAGWKIYTARFVGGNITRLGDQRISGSRFEQDVAVHSSDSVIDAQATLFDPDSAAEWSDQLKAHPSAYLIIDVDLTP